MIWPLLEGVSGPHRQRAEGIRMVAQEIGDQCQAEWAPIERHTFSLCHTGLLPPKGD